MPLDSAQTGLGFEIASLRALGEGRRRRSLADRLLRERCAAAKFGSAPAGRVTSKAPVSLPPPTESWEADASHGLD